MNLILRKPLWRFFYLTLKRYSALELDMFLDEIVEDYESFDESIQELSQAVMRYEEKIKELQQEIYTLQNENQSLNEKLSVAQSSGSYDQVDILKRIARLEQAVFKTEE